MAAVHTLAAVCLVAVGSAHAQAVVPLDRAVVRFSAPEVGGNAGPRFVFERMLAFESRLAALADAGHDAERQGPYSEHHRRVALERHIAETLLSSLRIDPAPTQKTVEGQMRLAESMLTAEVGGYEKLRAAARAEGIGTQELRRLYRRRARASLYLHQMVAPMLTPTNSELRELYGKTPLASEPFAKVKPALRRLFVSRALAEAVTTFYQNARARLRVTVLTAGTPEATSER
jgi:hypothetical protein